MQALEACGKFLVELDDHLVGLIDIGVDVTHTGAEHSIALVVDIGHFNDGHIDLAVVAVTD